MSFRNIYIIRVVNKQIGKDNTLIKLILIAIMLHIETVKRYKVLFIMILFISPKAFLHPAIRSASLKKLLSSQLFTFLRAVLLNRS